MADKKLKKLLDKAQKAYQKGDKRKGAQFVDQILRQDFAHPETWQFLHAQYGKDRPFDEFQRSFIQQFYPDKLALLDAGMLFIDAGQAPAPVPARKPSFLARLFGRKASQSAPAAPVVLQTAAQPVLQSPRPPLSHSQGGTTYSSIRTNSHPPIR
jgi:hypothetical protein